ncbi:MAG: 4-(cytidine 5'-diphospho)-2-C-methyl-D-erythritol kinase [Chitinispirillaceae bacterium]|nr:4-(cytidine 5'-diphospho)-2-C-methyl-D-erythritol kinase [Chitinispirillaceae bacterium]
MKLEIKSFTRVTLALDIIQRILSGPDQGYHELGTVKHRIDLHDALTVEDAPVDSIECDDPMVPCDGRNACMKVVHLLKRTFSIDRGVRIAIAKHIPVMGGLAGGSANAATTFEALNELWGLGLSTSRLIRLGRTIGMDVPYYFIGGTAFDSETGERLEPVATALAFTFVLAVPDFGVSTREAYEGIDYATAGKSTGMTADLRKALVANCADAVPSLMHNDFERTVFARHPRLAELKKRLMDAGCSAAVLSGSGSTVLGLAKDRVQAQRIGKQVDCGTIISSTLTAGGTTTATA